MSNILNPSKILALALLATGVAACGTTVVQSANHPESADSGVAVSGFGKVSGTPDIARANIGVEVRARTSEQATAETNEHMARLTQALKQLGIAERDLKTANFSVNFEQDSRPIAPSETAPAVPKAEPAGWYRAANSLEVTVRDLKLIGKVLGTATALGANTVNGVTFELSNPQALEAQAREKAVADAHVRAQQLAKLSGVELGPVIAISESVNFSGPMQAQMMMSKSADSESSSVAPIESGQMEVTSQVSLRYALRPARR